MLIQYLKQKVPKGGTIYSSSPEKFPKVGQKKKRAPILPPPIVEEIISPPVKSRSFEIQKGEMEKKEFSSDLHSFYEKMALAVHEKPKEAVVFTHPKLGELSQLLKNIATAIDTKCRPCSFLDISSIEEEGRWESFLSSSDPSFILLPDQILANCPKLKALYKEGRLGNIDCLILEQLGEIQTSATKKKALWELITQKLKP